MTLLRYRGTSLDDGSSVSGWFEEDATVTHIDGHEIDPDSLTIINRSDEVYRQTDDNRLVVSIDAGASDDQIHFSAFPIEMEGDETATEGQTGTYTEDLVDPDVSGAFKLQGFRAQVRGADFGDKLTIQVVSDGSIPTYFGPEGTFIRDFGYINAPLSNGATDWAKLEHFFSTAAEIPAGLKLRLEYVDVYPIQTKEIAVDLLLQVPSS